MAFPADVKLVRVTCGTGYDFSGDPIAITLEVTPVLGGSLKRLIHAATGTFMTRDALTFKSDPGSPATFTVPSPAQAETWKDGSGAFFTNWSYSVTVTTRTASGKIQSWIQSFQPVDGQETVDLDLVPDGQIGSPTSAPAPAVTSVNGQSGAVVIDVGEAVTPDSVAANLTAEAVDAKLPERLSESALSAAIDEKTAGLGGGVPKGALGPLRARLLFSDSQAVPLVFAGSSTTEGSNVALEDRWVTLIANGHPVITGYTAAAAPFDSGLTFINMGRSGFNSGSYMTTAEATAIGGWEPALVVHAIGANDAIAAWGSPTFVANNVATRIDAIDAAAALPVGHVLMHQHERYDQTLKFPWDDYLTELNRIAATRPNVAVFDATEYFESVGVPSTDPLGLMEADKTHVNESGHAYYSEIIGDLLNLPAYVPPTPPVTVISDNFNRADGTLHESAPTVGTTTWQVLSGTVTVTGNKAVASGTGATAVIETGKTDLDLYTTIDYAGPGAVGTVFKTLDINNRYGIFLESGALSLKLYRAVGGANAVVASSTALGDPPLGVYQVHVKIRGAQIEATVSGVTLTYTSPDPTGEAAWTKVGIRGSAGTPATFDDFSATTPAG